MARESETEFRTPILKIKEAENSDSYTKVFPYEGKGIRKRILGSHIEGKGSQKRVRSSISKEHGSLDTPEQNFKGLRLLDGILKTKLPSFYVYLFSTRH
ncbi:unnamed protein product [Rhizophagus irregularis]|nr:unnamed protein product [Rhizophagus irregularis]